MTTKAIKQQQVTGITKFDGVSSLDASASSMFFSTLSAILRSSEITDYYFLH